MDLSTVRVEQIEQETDSIVLQSIEKYPWVCTDKNNWVSKAMVAGDELFLKKNSDELMWEDLENKTWLVKHHSNNCCRQGSH